MNEFTSLYIFFVLLLSIPPKVQFSEEKEYIFFDSIDAAEDGTGYIALDGVVLEDRKKMNLNVSQAEMK